MTQIFIAVMSTIAKLWKEPRCPSTDEWIKMWYIHTHTHRNTMQPSKEMKSCHLQQHGWNKVYYAEQNKSIRNRQLSYDLPDMRNLRGRVVRLGGREGKNETRWDREGDKP